MPRKKAIFSEKFMFSVFGQKVQVQQELHRQYRDGMGTWTRCKPQYHGQPLGADPVGWVVGFRWLRTGKVIEGYTSFYGIDGFDPGEPNEFEDTGPRTPCLLVAYWPTMTPVKVPLDGYKLISGDDALAAPYPPNAQTKWTDRDREAYREGAAEQPRDSKGRWVQNSNAR